MKFTLPKLALSKQSMLTACAVGIAICVALAVYAFRGALFVSDQKLAAKAPSEVPEAIAATTYRHPLTGVAAETEVEKPFVFGVMIENMIDAWPQSGLEDAFLVIEAPVEAGISRFLAFYSAEQDVEKIGPVRSARPYYLDWADELNALYAHVGGSDAALRLISSHGTFDLNQYFSDSSFWRSADRLAPHNVYTSSNLLRSALDARPAPEASYGIWTFKEDAGSGQEAGNVSVDFSTPTYRVTWDYDPATNSYARLQAGSVHEMSDGDTITANNVAILVTSVKIIDAIGRRDIRTLGDGEAIILQDGLVKKGTWKKDGRRERLRFYDETGSEIVWNAGVTWVQVVPGNEHVVTTP